MPTYPVSLVLQDRAALVVGGGAVATRKVEGLLAAEAAVTVVAPEVTDALRALADAGRCAWRAKAYDADDLHGADIVFVATDDEDVNARAYRDASEAHLMVNVADRPELCTFFLPSVLRRGKLSIAVSTEGASPLTARRLRKELEERIAYFNQLLSSEEMLRGVLKEELTAIRDKYGDQRYTEIQDVEDEIDIEDLIEEEQCVFTLTQAGYIKRTPVSEYAAQSKGGMGKKGITTREEDTVVDVFTASTHDHILFFTDTGKAYRKKGYQIPESGKTAKGTNIINILQVESGERVQTMLHFRETGEEELYLFMVTRQGTVKRLAVSALKNIRASGIRALTLDEGDELVCVLETDGAQKVLVATHDGMAVCFDEQDVRPMGRTAVGVRGIRLREGDYVVGAGRAAEGRTVLSITENGYGKRTPVEEYRITNRGGLGIKNYMVTEKTGPVVGIKVVDGSEDLLLVTQAGILIRTHVDTIRTAGRATQGVIVMRFKEEGDRVISLALADRGEESTNSEENVENAPASGQDEIEAAEQESIEEL